jgi:sulfur-carrier protein
MTIDILYFAWVREAIGRDGEAVSPPPEATTVRLLLDWLMMRGEGYRRAFGEPEKLRAAADGAFVGLDHELAGVKELALFPPVTGG